MRAYVKFVSGYWYALNRNACRCVKATKTQSKAIGSSILAMFAGITTNNALPPHYHCPNCHKHEWVPEQKKDYEIGDEIVTKILKNGLDYETRTCPECGHEMWSDGFSGDFRSFCGAD